jgi:DNA modification methylase
MGQIYCADALEGLKKIKDKSVSCCITSPPYYGLRDYGVDGQIGLEPTPEEYISKLVGVFHEVWRVLRDDGTLWVNIGDSYCGTGNKGKYQDPKNPNGRNGQRKAVNHSAPGCKPKDLIGIPWMLAFALRADGWYLRQDIIWHKPNPMPESVKDRCTKSHEYIFLLSKSQKYYYNYEAILEDAKHESGMRYQYAFGGAKSASLSREGYGQTRPIGYRKYDGKRNKRDVWTVSTKPFKQAHFATFPPDLILPCILAGCPKGGTVLDPFLGSGTTAVVAKASGRDYIGIDCNPEYCKMAESRLENTFEQTKIEGI